MSILRFAAQKGWCPVPGWKIDHKTSAPKGEFRLLSRQEQRAILEKERKAWDLWMQARKKVSSLLPDNLREVYDYATYIVRREKVLQMKGREVFL